MATHESFAKRNLVYSLKSLLKSHYAPPRFVPETDMFLIMNSCWQNSFHQVFEYLFYMILQRFCGLKFCMCRSILPGVQHLGISGRRVQICLSCSPWPEESVILHGQEVNFLPSYMALHSFEIVDCQHMKTANQNSGTSALRSSQQLRETNTEPIRECQSERGGSEFTEAMTGTFGQKQSLKEDNHLKATKRASNGDDSALWDVDSDTEILKSFTASKKTTNNMQSTPEDCILRSVVTDAEFKAKVRASKVREWSTSNCSDLSPSIWTRSINARLFCNELERSERMAMKLAE